MIRSAPGTARPLVGACALLACALQATPATAQTPLTSIGLGYPVTPADGRAAALGGTGVGLLGGTFSLSSPADLTQHVAPGFGLAFTGEAVTVDGPSSSHDTGRERIAVVRAVAPFGDWAVAIAFGGDFDQDWSVRFDDTLALADGTTVPFEEAREHDGGISTIDASLARRIGPLSLGVSAQRLTGSLRQTFTRRFDESEDGGPPLATAGGSQRLTYRAWRFRAGVSIAISDRFLISAVGSKGGDLTIDPDEEEDPATTLALPTTVEVGASVRITDRLLVSASGGVSDWSPSGDLEDATAHDITWVGGGIEYQGPRILGGDMPLRVGVRRAELPFSTAASAVEETAITGGFGWLFREGTAGLHVGVEFGSRGDFATDGIEESFRRATLSFELRQR